ncbi:MAG: hypothetical protein K2L81_01770, partial [Muribaculaceae bacterium]|nr:hypothetical protein [Muribaculaceae bacterium]
MEEKIKENATIAGAAAAGAAVGAGAVLGVNAAMATPRPTSQADDKKAELKAEEKADDDEKTTDNPSAENTPDEENLTKDYSIEANLTDNDKAEGGIHTSQNVNVHVNHREIITPTEAEVTPEVKVLEYQMQINADGTTTDVAVLQVDGHNA